MATHFSPAWHRLRNRGRALAAMSALALTAALAACSATDAAPTAAGAHAAPAAVAHSAAPAGVVVTADVPYAGTADRAQQLDVCAPTATGKPRPAVLLIHGGGWHSGDKSTVQDTCEWLAKSGFVTFNIDYRLWPTARYPAQPDDALAALRFLRAPATVRHYEIDPTRLGVFGGSAGGNLAATLATHDSGLKALVDLSGPMDLTAGQLTARQDPRLTADETGYLNCPSLARCPSAPMASPLLAVSAATPPTFIGQASVDFVPREQGDAFAAALKKAGVPVTVEVTQGKLHSFGVLTPRMQAAIAGFLHRQLGE
ncbi:alpha/beta hydrolase [Gryllotalpicola protaetiae]|uniref:Alpha/beta hydrolase n=2 Tax=Gryllotalpicola protaetiae TaxID=2419771 RepID=A0A387BH28_9MICO|nr:alpha/beta hydrolase [Gryllotalpicola protaetiae]